MAPLQYIYELYVMRHLERKTIVWKFQTHPFGVHSDKQALELSLLVKWQTGIMRW